MRINPRKNINYGFVSISIWCVLTALGYVYSSSIEQDTPIGLMCFILFTFSTLIFTVLNSKNLPRLFELIKLNFKNVIIVNLTTFSGWVFLFYAIKYIDPSVANTMVIGCIPIYILLMNKFNNYQLNQKRQNNFTAIFLGMGVSYLIILLFNDNSISLGASFKEIVSSLVLCLVSGFCLAANNIHIKKLSNSEFTPLDILTIRYIFGCVVAGVYAGLTGELNTSIQLAAVSPVFLNAIILVVIPQIAMQIALRELEPFTVGIIMPFMPVLMFMMEFSTERLHPTFEVFVGVVGIWVISFGGSVLRYRAERISSFVELVERGKA
jgi:drug/metabolite transporter (DMT)-like permease